MLITFVTAFRMHFWNFNNNLTFKPRLDKAIRMWMKFGFCVYKSHEIKWSWWHPSGLLIINCNKAHFSSTFSSSSPINDATIDTLTYGNFQHQSQVIVGRRLRWCSTTVWISHCSKQSKHSHRFAVRRDCMTTWERRKKKSRVIKV